MSIEKRLREVIEGFGRGTCRREALEWIFENPVSPEEKEEAAEMLQRLKSLSMDDSVEMVVHEYPLKYILQVLSQKYGRDEVRAALNELDRRA